MKTLKFLKYKGKFYPAGSTIEVDSADIPNFVERGLVTPSAVEEPDESDNNPTTDELTVAEIKELLDEAGIEYNARARKEDLLALLEEGGEDE